MEKKDIVSVEEMEEVLRQFCMDGAPVAVESYGTGHVNRTYHITCDSGKEYTLQRISRVAFHHPEQLIANIAAVTEYLSRLVGKGEQVLHLVPTLDGSFYTVDSQGEYWRMYAFLSGGICLDLPRNREDFYQCAMAFGRFQELLSDFPADTLYETIPGFHNTIQRMQAFREAVQQDPLGRAKEIQREIDFCLAREEEAGELCRMQARGELPLRVTHNDTKLNNVLLDGNTGKAMAVLDLDTVMPGLAAVDFGDAIRFGASTAPEDETDLDKVSLDLGMFEAYTDGFLTACGHSLTDKELECLTLGVKIITLELATRFLVDHLQGDQYFAIHRPGQNLDRARTQLKLVADIEAKWDAMQEIVKKMAVKHGL